MKHRRVPAAAAAVLTSLALGACSEPAPLAQDRWPGFDPDAGGPILFDVASLTLHLRSDRRDASGRIELDLPDGSHSTIELPSRIANDDQLPLGLYEPGTITVRVVLDEGGRERATERRVRLENRRHHGLAFDLRTPTTTPSALRLDLGPPDESFVVSEGRLIEPRARLYPLDAVLEARRTAGADPEGLDLEVALGADGHLWLEAQDLARGEHVVRVEPGGLERLLWLDEGQNVFPLTPAPALADLAIELVDGRTGLAPEQVVAHWTAPVDGQREPTLVAPVTADYRDGRLELRAPVGTVHLLLNAGGIGTRFRSIQLPPEGVRGRLEL